MELLEPAISPPRLRITYYSSLVGAGFPSPAADYVEGRLDLNQLLVKRPAATFMVRVSGRSMMRAGIFEGDIVIVDRSQRPADGDVMVAVVDGSLVVKRFHRDGDGVSLLSDPDPDEADQHPPIVVTEGMQFECWGRVTASIHFT
ncbi:Error-prone repair protein UmuD [Azospirillum argentinense]|uniref:LexA family protein n=1 Tax=Azospirillum argentinense TaxID=2970906 RepID=UPI0032DF27E8